MNRLGAAVAQSKRTMADGIWGSRSEIEYIVIKLNVRVTGKTLGGRMDPSPYDRYGQHRDEPNCHKANGGPREWHAATANAQVR